MPSSKEFPALLRKIWRTNVELIGEIEACKFDNMKKLSKEACEMIKTMKSEAQRAKIVNIEIEHLLNNRKSIFKQDID